MCFGTRVKKIDFKWIWQLGLDKVALFFTSSLEYDSYCMSHAAWLMVRVGTKKLTKMDFHEILPLDQFKSESKEFLGYFYVEFLVFTRR